MDQALITTSNTADIVEQSHYSYNKISALEGFMKQLNENPPQEELKQTPDNQAMTLPISFVEMKLDEIYFGQWGASGLEITQIGNELIGNLVLWVVHPVSGLRIEKPGTAAVQITVDAVPERLSFKSSDSQETKEQKKKERNSWALDLQNKKPNGLSKVAPKLKQEAIKNAAKSLGKIFGRDINREHVDTYESIYSDAIQVEHVRDELTKRLQQCKTLSDLGATWEEYKLYHNNPAFKRIFTSYKSKLAYS